MSESEPPSSLPPALRGFAPWTWSRRTRWALAALIPILYLEAVVPIAVSGRLSSAPTLPAPAEAMAEAFWAPVIWGYNEFPVVAIFYDVQIDHLVDTLETAGF